MISITKASTAVAITIIFCQQGIAQKKSFSTYSKWEVGGGLSAYIYQGDLTPRRIGSIETTKSGLLLFGNYKIKDHWRIQGSFAMGSLKGSDAKYSKPAYRQERNFLFTTPVKELSVKLLYQLHRNYDSDANFFYPYIGTGIALNFINVKKDYSDLTEKLSSSEPSILAGIAADNATGTPRRLVSLPIVVGIRKMYNERWDLFAEANYRYVFNDYLDGFSQAANPNKQDKFYTLSIGVVYKFKKNNSIGCPTY